MKRLSLFDKVNWHIIISREEYWVFYTRCWNCWTRSVRTLKALHKSKRCKTCQDIVKYTFSWRTITQWAWILWINRFTIENRIKRWRTMKDALFFKKQPREENFNEKDLKYLSDDLEKNHEKHKKLEDRAYLKYLMNKNIW